VQRGKGVGDAVGETEGIRVVDEALSLKLADLIRHRSVASC
jgi:hypothetical protein